MPPVSFKSLVLVRHGEEREKNRYLTAAMEDQTIAEIKDVSYLLIPRRHQTQARKSHTLIYSTSEHKKRESKENMNSDVQEMEVSCQ